MLTERKTAFVDGLKDEARKAIARLFTQHRVIEVGDGTCVVEVTNDRGEVTSQPTIAALRSASLQINDQAIVLNAWGARTAIGAVPVNDTSLASAGETLVGVVKRLTNSIDTTLATPQQLTDLTFRVESGETWEIDYYILSANPIRYALTVPDQTTLSGYLIGMGSVADPAPFSPMFGSGALGITFDADASFFGGWMQMHATITSSQQSGNISISFASPTAGQSCMVIGGSSVRAFKMT